MRRTLVLFLGAAIALLYSGSLGIDDVSGRRLEAGGGSSRPIIGLPVTTSKQDTIMRIELVFTPGSSRTADYRFLVDDCLVALAVNGRRLADIDYPVCRFPRWFTLDLKDYLRPGENRLHAVVQNFGGPGSLDLQRSPTDGLQLVVRFIGCLLLIWGAWNLSNQPAAARWKWVIRIAAAGTVVRLLYAWAANYYERSHDYAGHLEYIRFLYDVWSVPEASAGWEFYQPPLYYALLAAWARTAAFFGAGFDAAIGHFVGISLLISIAALAVSAWLSTRLFESPRSAACFVGLTAFAPAVVFQSARITNDTLQLLCMAAAVAVLAAWWQQPTQRRWLLLSLLVCLSALIKANGLILFGVSLVLLVLQDKLPRGRRLYLGVLMGAAFIALTGWYFYIRAILHGEKHIFGPILSMSSELILKNNLSAFFTFNPAALLQHPYNDPWTDSERRIYFWEFFYRSIYAGEFSWGDSIRPWVVLCLFTGFPMIALLGAGLWSELRHHFRRQLPMAGILSAFTAGLLYFRLKYPYAACQDFRFVLIIILPIAYYVVRGAERVDQRHASAGSLLIVQHLIVCLLLLLGMYWFSAQ